MAWTEVRYSCGHEDRVQMFGPGRERDARIWSYSQRLCPECWRSKRAGAPAVPRVFWRAGADAALIHVFDAYDVYPYLKRQGYSFGELEDPDRRDRNERAQNDRVEPRWTDAEDDLAKGWARRIPRADLDRELAWLRELGARFPAEERAVKPIMPDGFDGADFEPWTYDRVAEACERVRKALAGARKPYVAFSGGKDSTVVAALVHAVRPEADLFWSDAELEFPETVEFMEATARRLGERLRITLGVASHGGWFFPWSEEPHWREPLPGSIVKGRNMGEWARDEGYDLTFLGLRADESKVRGAFLAEAGATYRRRTGRVAVPIWDWDADLVWAVIRGAAIPYNAAYDRFADLELDERLRRVGPLPLAPRDTLERGWPDLMQRLDHRYPGRWR